MYEEHPSAPPEHAAMMTIAHPYREGLIVLGLLCGLFAVLAAVSGGLALAGWLTPVWAVVAGVFVLCWALMLAAIWGWGMFKLRQMKDFVSSTRPLIRWCYTPDEWALIQEEQELAQREGLLLAPGCLAVLCAIVGVLVGSMLGFDTGIAEALLGGGVGLLSGAAVGGLLGATVAGGNYLAHRWAHQHDQQMCVALGATEMLYGHAYFRSNDVTHFIEKISLDVQEVPPYLVVELQNPKLLGDDTESWAILVPQRVVASLKRVLPEVRTRS
jgi:hypothetical protein